MNERIGEFIRWYVVTAGVVVITSMLIMFYAMAYLRFGHPPGSGIVGMIVLFVASPIATIASLLGLFSRQDSLSVKVKTYYIMTGINIAFSFFVLFIFIFKVILGKTI